MQPGCHVSSAGENVRQTVHTVWGHMAQVNNWIIKARLTKACAPPPAERRCQRSVTSSIYVHWSLWGGWGFLLKAHHRQLLCLSFTCRKRNNYLMLIYFIFLPFSFCPFKIQCLILSMFPEHILTITDELHSHWNGVENKLNWTNWINQSINQWNLSAANLE